MPVLRFAGARLHGVVHTVARARCRRQSAAVLARCASGNLTTRPPVAVRPRKSLSFESALPECNLLDTARNALVGDTRDGVNMKSILDPTFRYTKQRQYRRAQDVRAHPPPSRRSASATMLPRPRRRNVLVMQARRCGAAPLRRGPRSASA